MPGWLVTTESELSAQRGDVLSRTTGLPTRPRLLEPPPWYVPPLLQAGLFGMDINKKGSKEGEKKVPESLGLAAGVVFLVSLLLGGQGWGGVGG